MSVKSTSKTFEIEGMEELRQKILELPDRTKRLEVLKILRREMADIRTAVRNATPISPRNAKNQMGVIPSGNLKKSIAIITGKSRLQPSVFVGPRVKSKDRYNGFYASFLVYGTGTSEKNKKHYDYIRKAAAPYLNRTSEAAANKIAQYIDKRIKQL